MDTTEIQRRVDIAAAVCTDKGLAQVTCAFHINSEGAPNANVMWHELRDGMNYQHQFFSGDDAGMVLANLESWSANLPDREERKKAEFTVQLAKTIEMGRANGIDVQFVNPLIEAMKRLSENAIEDHSDGQ